MKRSEIQERRLLPPWIPLRFNLMTLIQKIDLLANLRLLLQGFLPAINELTYFYLLKELDRAPKT
jgi:hypothetical protein